MLQIVSDDPGLTGEAGLVFDFAQSHQDVLQSIFAFNQFGLISKIPGKEGHWLLSRLSLMSMSLSLFAGYFLQGSSELAPILVLILAMLTDLNSTQAFGNMANHFLTLQETKKLLPMIYASGSIGYIISGITIKFVLDIIGISGLLIGNAVLLFILAMILQYLRKFENQRICYRN